MTGVVYNNEDEPRYEYAYNAQGQVAHVRNNLLGRTTASEYDLANRPCRVKTHTDDGVHVYTGEVAYDDTYGNLSEFKEKVGEARTEYSTTFGYDEENRPTSLSYGAHGQTTLTYDKLGRVRQSSVKAGSGVTNTTTYAFEAGGHGENSTTGLVKSISQTGGNFAYTYDDNGNIVSVVQDGKTTAYTYDELGQLIRVDDEQENATWVYEYDMGGNILSKQKFAYGVTDGEPLESKVFTYGNANWKDQLTAVNDVPITYDEIGNPLNDGEWTYTWQNGRQLASMTNGTTTASFVYNEQGLRVQKTVNGIVTNYTLHGKNIVHMTQGENELHFFYDAKDRPAVVVYNGTPYSYVKNLQGDIVAILDSNKNIVVNYVYDAWGRPISKMGSMATTLGTVQPFRYRGYVYDEEIDAYYLRNRYYNVIWMRFMNADILLTRNVYQYCNNSPCRYADPSGLEAETAGLFPDTIVIDVDAAIPAPTNPEQYFNMYYLPLIMSYLNDPADYDYPYQGGHGKPIDCSHLMQDITGYGSPMAKERYDDFSGNKGALFENGELAVELVVGMEVFKTSKRSDGTSVLNGHVGMLIKYDFGDGNGEVWAVFQSVSVPVSKTPARYPKGTDRYNGPNITRFYNYDGSCKWENYIDPWYYSNPDFVEGY